MRNSNLISKNFFLLGCLLISIYFNFYLRPDSGLSIKNRCEVVALTDHQTDHVTKPVTSGLVQFGGIVFVDATVNNLIVQAYSRSKESFKNFYQVSRQTNGRSLIFRLCVIRI